MLRMRIFSLKVIPLPISIGLMDTSPSTSVDSLPTNVTITCLGKCQTSGIWVELVHQADISKPRNMRLCLESF